jgi:RHS repeat-associated protein
MSLTVDLLTNQTTTGGFLYDGNGNLTNLPNVSGTLAYDIENRTGSSNSLYSNLAYDMENQPLDRGGQGNLYGLNGERLGTYTYTFGRDVTYINGVDYDTTPVYPAQATRNIYFGGRLIQSNNTTVVVDAQGSVRANESGQTFEFYPYGEEIGSGTTNGREKFATYTREANGLDYANQRYYSSTYGAFTSADPLHETATTPADPNNPGTWNRFAYTAGDPINRIDPSGTENCVVDSFDGSGDSDDGDVNLGSHCGSGFAPSAGPPDGATVCHTLPGVIFTFNSVPSTCQNGILVAVDTSHVAQPICNLSVIAQGFAGTNLANHTVIVSVLIGGRSRSARGLDKRQGPPGDENVQ